MSLDEAIKHGKEKRKPYRGAKACDPWCRNHGYCWICRENRLHKYRISQEEFKRFKKMHNFIDGEWEYGKED